MGPGRRRADATPPRRQHDQPAVGLDDVSGVDAVAAIGVDDARRFEDGQSCPPADPANRAFVDHGDGEDVKTRMAVESMIAAIGWELVGRIARQAREELVGQQELLGGFAGSGALRVRAPPAVEERH
ncbi:MAG TPA: hypothetical protein VFI28_02075 [Candidatus Limnocylindrales bacterium]|nr:hypothetical protein [Candidatus Limnocylindrales bacterium]